MSRASQLLLSIFLLAGLSGCMLLNNVVRIAETEAAAPDINHSVVIFGIGVEGAWKYPRFAVVLDEYDIERQSITGNCWRYNKMEASVPKDSRAVQRFAFEVEPGYYSFSGFNAVKLVGPSAFSASAGQIVYLGDFIYSGERTVVLRRSDDTTKRELLKEYPSLVDKITPAKAISVAAPKIFLCTP
jgi:hypothetical protein